MAVVVDQIVLIAPRVDMRGNSSRGVEEQREENRQYGWCRHGEKQGGWLWRWRVCTAQHLPTSHYHYYTIMIGLSAELMRVPFVVFWLTPENQTIN